MLSICKKLAVKFDIKFNQIKSYLSMAVWLRKYYFSIVGLPELLLRIGLCLVWLAILSIWVSQLISGKKICAYALGNRRPII